jgi:2-haloacid dehalogenase
LPKTGESSRRNIRNTANISLISTNTGTNRWAKKKPESLALLFDLQKAGYATYGLSNWSAETFPLTKKAHPFFNSLTGIVISGEEKVRKPDPKIYRILLERYGLLPQESVFIDDRQENLDEAKRLGIHGILFQTAQQVREDLKSLNVLKTAK